MFWIAICGVGVAWCGLAAIRSPLLASPGVKAVFGLSLAATIAATVWFRPTTRGRWMQEVRWTTGTARAGQGENLPERM